MGTPATSRTEMTEIVMPSDTNNLGTVFGGKLMQWIDLCAAIAARRHCRMTVVTASVDDLSFLTPIHAGEFVLLVAQVNAVFRTSMEVEVRVQGEEPLTGERRHCVQAYLTFVALDVNGRVCSAPPLELGTEDDRQREREAHARRQRRLRHRSASVP